MKQYELIKKRINELLDLGYTDKHLIFSTVTKELDVPRPTVRRITRDLRTELLKKVLILQSDNPGAITL